MAKYLECNGKEFENRIQVPNSKERIKISDVEKFKDCYIGLGRVRSPFHIGLGKSAIVLYNEDGIPHEYITSSGKWGNCIKTVRIS